MQSKRILSLGAALLFSSLANTVNAATPALTSLEPAGSVEPNTRINFKATVRATSYFRLWITVDGVKRKVCHITAPTRQRTFTCPYKTPSKPGKYRLEVKLNANNIASRWSRNVIINSQTLVVGSERSDKAGDNPTPPPGYSLYFNDEFNSNSGAPDSNYWDYGVSHVRNNELQCYTDNRRANVRVENRNVAGESGGYLVLQARKENWSCPQDPGKNYRYTSGAITTRVRHNGDYLVGRTMENQPQQGMPFGIYEIRAKIPAGRGTWPAIWLLGHKNWSASDPSNIGWPAAGEIDIMEAVGFEEASGLYRLHSALHRSKDYRWPHDRRTTGLGMTYDLNEPPSSRFHVWKMIWERDSIEIFVDGNRVQRMEVADGRGRLVHEDRYGFYRRDEGMNANTALGWPFSGELNNEFKLILNLAYGGGWGGQEGVDDSIFSNGPVKMLVDYVRVYKRN